MTDISSFCKRAIYAHVLDADVKVVTSPAWTKRQQAEVIRDWLLLYGFQAIWPKVTDGAYKYKWKNPNTGKTTDNLTREMVDVFKTAGIKVIGWGMVYGFNPAGEANMAVVQANELGLDGFIFDAEGTFDGQKTAEANAYIIGNTVRTACPNLPLGYCGWPRFWNPNKPYDNIGTWHPVAVAKAFMHYCDVITPMMYWDGDTVASALSLLNQSLEQQARITSKPCIPTGRAYIGDWGKANKDNVIAFQEEAVRRGALGISWWFLNHAAKYPDIAAGLKQGGQFGESIPEPRRCPTCNQIWPEA